MTGSLVGSTWCLQETETNVDEWRHFYFLATNQNKSHYFIKLLLDEDLHDGPADLHPHAVLLEHV